MSLESQCLKILDFNVAQFEEKTWVYNKRKWNNFKMRVTTGTLAFTAPEVYSANAYTELVDAWSVGCILYDMLSGYHPFYAPL